MITLNSLFICQPLVKSYAILSGKSGARGGT
jgi:hypothetical protein